MFYYSAVLLWPQQVQALFTKDVTYAGWLSVRKSLSYPSRQPLTMIVHRCKLDSFRAGVRRGDRQMGWEC
jgi:hypothetical protein